MLDAKATARQVTPHCVVRGGSQSEGVLESSSAELRISCLLRAWQIKTSVGVSMQHQNVDCLLGRALRR